MVLQVTRPSRARYVFGEVPQPKGEWAKSLDGQPAYVADPERIRQQNTERDDQNLVELLEGVQELELVEQIDKPIWAPPENEDCPVTVHTARGLLCETLEHDEPLEWAAERVWYEMYLREYARADQLRRIAQKLDGKLDEEVKNIEEHNDEITRLSSLARRLQLDVGL